MTTKTIYDLLDWPNRPGSPLILGEELLRPWGTQIPAWLSLCADFRARLDAAYSDSASRNQLASIEDAAAMVLRGIYPVKTAQRFGSTSAQVTTKLRRVLAIATHHRTIPGCTSEGPRNLEDDLLSTFLFSAHSSPDCAGLGDPRRTENARDGTSMLVLVVLESESTERYEQPMAMELRLWRVSVGRRVNATNTFVRAPGSFLWLTDASFDRGCLAVDSLLKHFAKGNQRFAVAWDVRPIPGGPHGDAPTLTTIRGASASAAMGLGALWLLRHYVHDVSLRSQLFDCDPQEIAVTAELKATRGPRFALGAVGGLDTKAQIFALEDQVHRPLPKRFFVCRDQRFSTRDLEGTPRQPIRVSDFTALIAEAAAEAESEISKRAKELFVRLCAGESIETIQKEDGRLFADVAGSRPISMKGYLLHRYAKWARGDHDILEQEPRALVSDFVRIDLVNQRTDDSTPQSKKHLAELIESDPHAPAWLLIAGPGAGKTTLLAQWELGRVAHALHRGFGAPPSLLDQHPETPEFGPEWCEKAPNDPPGNSRDIELAVFLPFKALTFNADDDGVEMPHALANFWKLSYPQMPPLAYLLRKPGLRIRFLLDAVNEANNSLNDQSIERLARWFAAQPTLLRPVITVRELQRAREIHTSGWRPRVAQLQAWEREHIDQYIDRRLPGDAYEAARIALRQRIDEDAALARLFQTPGNLAVQCSVLRKLPGTVLSDRAALFVTLIILRLRAALPRITERALVTEDARQALNTYSPRAAFPVRLPRGGKLLPWLEQFARLTRGAGALSCDKALLCAQLETSGVISEAQVDAWVSAGRETTLLYAPEYRGTVTTGDVAARLRVGEPRQFDFDRVSWTWELFSEFFWARGRKPDAALAEELRRTAVPLDPPTQRELVERLKSGALDLMPRAVDHPQTQSLIFAVQLCSDAADIEAWITWLAAIDLTLAGRIAVAVRSRLEPNAHQCWDKSAAMNKRYGAANPALKTLRAALLKGFTEPLLDPGKPDEANSYADIRHRREWALLLGELGGDARFELCESATVKDQAGQGLRYLKPKAEYLCRIGDPHDDEKATTYWIGDETSGEKDEVGEHGKLVAIELKPYHVSAFPVTNAEYRYFVEAGGYEDERWWKHGDAKTWRADFVRKRADEGRPLQPRGWEYGDSDNDNGLQPVTGISWFEATAYACWLSACEGSTTASKMIRLLTEGEWRAAAGGAGRDYGEDPKRHRRRWAYAVGNGQVSPKDDPLLINCRGTRLDRTTPVGLFPRGRTPEGVEDLSGNFWEWTSSAYTERLDPDALQAGYGQCEAATMPERVALAVGSCWDEAALSRVCYRGRGGPDFGFIYYGFRLCGWRAHTPGLLRLQTLSSDC